MNASIIVFSIAVMAEGWPRCSGNLLTREATVAVPIDPERAIMLDRLARLAVARPKAVLAATLVLMVAALAYGSGISERLSGGGFYSVSSESQRAAALLEQRFHVGKPNLVVLATDTGGGPSTIRTQLPPARRLLNSSPPRPVSPRSARTGEPANPNCCVAMTVRRH